jgi:uncharacterized protein
MAVSYSWLLEDPPAPDVSTPSSTTSSSFGGSLTASQTLSAGLRGVIRPFTRDGVNDVATASGAALLRAEIGQVLATVCSSGVTQGELPWRPDFGSLLYLIRHRKADFVTKEMARAYVVDALAKWLPQIRITDVEIEPVDSTLSGLSTLLIRVRYEIQAVGTGRIVGSDTTAVVA